LDTEVDGQMLTLQLATETTTSQSAVALPGSGITGPDSGAAAAAAAAGGAPPPAAADTQQQTQQLVHHRSTSLQAPASMAPAAEALTLSIQRGLEQRAP